MTASPAQTIRDYLTDNEIEFEEPGEGVIGFALPGEKKLQTAVRLDVGTHHLAVHAFVCRKPDENHEEVYRWLLQKNLRTVRRLLRGRPRRRHLPRRPPAARRS